MPQSNASTLSQGLIAAVCLKFFFQSFLFFACALLHDERSVVEPLECCGFAAFFVIIIIISSRPLYISRPLFFLIPPFSHLSAVLSLRACPLYVSAYLGTPSVCRTYLRTCPLYVSAYLRTYAVRDLKAAGGLLRVYLRTYAA